MQKLLSWVDGLFKYCAAAVLLVVALYPKFPSIRIPGTYVAIRLEDFLMVAFGILIVVRILPTIHLYLKRDIERAILIYLGVGAVSLLSAMLILKTAPLKIGLLHWVRRIEYFLPFLAGGILLKDKRKDVLPFLIKLLGAVVVICFIYGFGQRYFGWPIIITQNEEYAKGVALRWVPGSHVNATFAGHYDLATFLVMVLPLLIALMVLVKDKRPKLALFAIFLAGVWLLANTVSRLSVVSYLIALSLTLILLRKFRAWLAVILVSLAVFISTGALIMRYGEVINVTKIRIQKIQKKIFGVGQNRVIFAADPQTLERKPSTATPTPQPVVVIEDRSSSIRFNVEWPRAIRAFTKNPLLGTGYSSITLATDNDYLRLLGETGILGFLAFGLIFVRIGETLLKSLPFKFAGIYEKAFVAGFVGALPGIFLNAAFIDIFEASKFAILFWLLMGILVAMARLNRNEQ